MGRFVLATFFKKFQNLMKEEIGKDITVTYVIESLKAKRLFLKQQLFWIFLYFMQVYKF